MSPDKLIRMANQIAGFFHTQPGTDQADRVAAHLLDFWDPSMRSALKAHIDQGGQGLDDLVLKAAPQL
jgi:formate dehydrogenase subunit delta